MAKLSIYLVDDKPTKIYRLKQLELNKKMIRPYDNVLFLDKVKIPENIIEEIRSKVNNSKLNINGSKFACIKIEPRFQKSGNQIYSSDKVYAYIIGGYNLTTEDIEQKCLKMLNFNNIIDIDVIMLNKSGRSIYTINNRESLYKYLLN